MDDEGKKYALRVSEDAMNIFLDGTVLPEDAAQTATLVDEELVKMGVLGSYARTELADRLTAAAKENEEIEDFMVAQGKACVPPVAGRVEWARNYFETGFAVDEKTGAIDYRKRAAKLSVKKGEPIAKIFEPVEGKDGLDVFGKPVKAPAPKAVPAKPGVNVRYDEEKKAYFAEQDGRIRLGNNLVAIDYVFNVEGNVGLETGNVEHPGSLVVKGDVEPGAEIEAGGDVEIYGTVESANITAGGSITVRGGITSAKGKRIKAGGSVFAKFILDATIEASDDIVVEKEIVQSVCKARGSVRIPGGRIVGGETIALGGVVAGHAGSEAAVRTVVAPGEDYLLTAEFAAKKKKIEKLEASAEKISSQVRPLMAQPKRLTHKQREMATELLASVSLMEMSAGELREEVEQLESDSKERALPEAVINGVVYAETYFRIRGVELKIKEPRKGPLRAFRRRLLVQLESI